MRIPSILTRLPLIIFIASVLASFAGGYALIYYTILSNTSTANPGFLHLKTQYLEMDFPKNWYAGKWEEGNQTSGLIFTMAVYHNQLPVMFYVRIYDDKASQAFLSGNHLTDAFSVVVFEVDRIYDWTLENSPTATLVFMKNGTMVVSSSQAKYSSITVLNGFNQDVLVGNLTGTFVSWFKQQRVVEIVFYGREQEWNDASIQTTFNVMLNSINV